MKKIETLIENAKNDYIGLVIPNDLIDIAIKYFNNKDLTEYVNDLTEYEKRELVIDFCNGLGELDYGLAEWYKDHNYKLITLTKDDFKDITEDVDNRTFIIMLYNRPVINSQSKTIYFNEEEYSQYLDTLDNLRDVVIIPTYGKQFERTAHISFY